ncbi:MAG: MucB/RseB C-terminal domain-containing protein [Ahniella sp.]|nr:MucB/RseB C-terminal domain-containing protein [Ahniella sp.]
MLNRMPNRCRPVLTALVLAGTFEAMAADGLSWLRQMQQAQRYSTVEGVAVYAHDGRIDAIRILHQPGPDEQGQFANLGGDRRQLLRSGDQVLVQMEGATVGAWPAFARFESADADHVGKLYDVREIGKDKVAGLEAVVVLAEPRDELRFVQQIWFDRASGLILGNVVLDQRRQPLEQVMFTTVRTSSALASGALPEAIPERATQASSIALNLPAGFMFVAERRDNYRHLDQFLLTDGLALVSIYREARPAPTQGDFASRRGAVNLYGRQGADLRWVAIGNVPLPTLRELIESNAGP